MHHPRIESAAGRRARWTTAAAVAFGVALFGFAFVLQRTEVGRRFDHEAGRATRAALADVAAHETVLEAARAVTFLGDVPVVITVAVLSALLALRRDRRLAAVCAGATLGAEIVKVALKHAFARARPEFDWADALPESFAFPSGHSMVPPVAYGLLAVVLARTWPRLRVPLALVLPPLVLAIAWSRVVLGLHWPTDVLGGLGLGLALLAVAVTAAQRSPGA